MDSIDDLEKDLTKKMEGVISVNSSSTKELP